VGYGLGVDLGTSFTGVAVGRHGKTRTVSLGDDPILVSSLVAVRPPGSLLVREVDETVPVVLGGRPYPAVAVLAEALRSALAAVTASEGEPPDQVVLTCPAVWGPARRQQFGEVSRRAGLTSVTVVSEPEAAVTGLVDGRRLVEDDVVVVYDIGGVTVDMTVVRVTDSGMEILGLPEGADGAGGADFDDLILAHVDRLVGGALSELDLADPVAVGVLTGVRAECIRAKEALSRNDTATVRVIGLASVVGLTEELAPIQLARADFEAMIRRPLTSTLAGLRRVLDSAGVQPADLTAVVLVGGSSRIPLVSRMLTKSLARPVLVDEHPQHCVALGAAAIADGTSTIAGGARRITPGAPPITDSIPTIAAAAAMVAAAAKSAEGAAKTGAKAGGKQGKNKPAVGKQGAGKQGNSTSSSIPGTSEMIAATFPGAGSVPVDVTQEPLSRRAGGHRMPRMGDWRRRVNVDSVQERRWWVVMVTTMTALLIGGGTYAFSPLGPDGADPSAQVVDSAFGPSTSTSTTAAPTTSPPAPTPSTTSAPARTKAPSRTKAPARKNPPSIRPTRSATRTTPPAPTGALVGQQGKCLDLFNGVDNDGTAVQVFGCNGSRAQRWTAAGDGTLRILGKCLQIVDVGANHLHLQIFSCNGSDLQKWVLGSGTVFNRATSECLDVLRSNPEDRTPVIMDDCDGTSSQNWTLS
jgi:actin-like ATPase involved in cell morphogenesis